MTPAIVMLFGALHLGGLHPLEQVLVYVLAFGPFIVLGIVVYFVRRRDLADEDDEGS